MSIIGPRPLLVSYLPWYTEEEKQRHDVRPGLSGLAQVNGRNSVTWEEKFSWDLKYVDRITFLGDVKITLDTVKKAFIKVEGVELNHEGNLLYISFSEVYFNKAIKTTKTRLLKDDPGLTAYSLSDEISGMHTTILLIFGSGQFMQKGNSIYMK